MRISKLACACALLAVALILVGCSGARVMMPTPNVGASGTSLNI